MQHESRYISNSFAVDKFGGIYIVSATHMNKL